MWCGVVKINCFPDPLPNSDEGSFRDRPQAISDDKSIELPVRTQDIDQSFIKRDASFSSFTLGITKDGLVVQKGNRLLHEGNHNIITVKCDQTGLERN